MKKKQVNRKLAAQLRAEFAVSTTPTVVDGYDVWGAAKQSLSEGFTFAQAARHARMNAPAAVQDAVKERKVLAGMKKAAKHAPVIKQHVALNEQAKRVRDGKVLRDAQGRILPRVTVGANWEDDLLF